MNVSEGKLLLGFAHWSVGQGWVVMHSHGPLPPTRRNGPPGGGAGKPYSALGGGGLCVSFFVFNQEKSIELQPHKNLWPSFHCKTRASQRSMATTTSNACGVDNQHKTGEVRG